MFEEIVVWSRSEEVPDLAKRYSGYRDLKTGQVCVLYYNLVTAYNDDGVPLSANQLIAPDLLVEDFLAMVESDDVDWKGSILEAVEAFEAAHTFD